MTNIENRLATEEEIKTFRDNYPDWKLKDSSLEVNYKFPDFKVAFDFMSSVATQAENLGHHPTWSNTFNQVDIKLSTHDLSDQVSLLDIELAKKISDIYLDINPSS